MTINVTSPSMRRISRKLAARAEAIAAYDAALQAGDVQRAAAIAAEHDFQVLDWHQDWNRGGRERRQAAIRRAQSRRWGDAS